jgi:integrase
MALQRRLKRCSNQRGTLAGPEVDGPRARQGTQTQGRPPATEDARWVGAQVRGPKGGKGRTIRLPARTVEALKAHRARQAEVRLKAGSLYQDEVLVFASEIDTPLEPSNIDRRSFKPLLKKAGLPNIRFHDLRHTCATVLLSQGVNPKFVQELLGHADIKLTLGTYSHFLPSMGEQTANAMEIALG